MGTYLTMYVSTGLTHRSWYNLVQEVAKGNLVRELLLSGIHPEFSFPVIPDMFTYLERCPPALSVYVLTHPDP